MSEAYKRAQDLLDRIDVLSRLSPCAATDAETAYTLSMLIEIIGETASKLRIEVDAMAMAGGAE